MKKTYLHWKRSIIKKVMRDIMAFFYNSKKNFFFLFYFWKFLCFWDFFKTSFSPFFLQIINEEIDISYVYAFIWIWIFLKKENTNFFFIPIMYYSFLYNIFQNSMNIIFTFRSFTFLFLSFYSLFLLPFWMLFSYIKKE